MLSMHTSPLAQPGTGDGGGMNVYVRELATALARSGVRCEVFTRAWDPEQPEVIAVEPGFRVHHVPAGPVAPVAKEVLPDLVAEWTRRVGDQLAGRYPIDALHANYWLSGQAAHELKHELDRPLVSTFHTLDRVKADASPEEVSAAQPARRALAEAEIIGCSDAVLASCSVEADQLIQLYQADPARIEIVAPGIDRAFFAPGDQAQPRRAIGFAGTGPVVLFVGRIQPLKGLAVAVAALGEVVETARRTGDARVAKTVLIVIGGPSGPHGPAEAARVEQIIAERRLSDHVVFVPPQRHELLSTYYRAADACVVPSRSESFGLVALEAAACGLPVVAAAVGGLSTLVDHDRTGFLVEERDPSVYARFLWDVLVDPARARRMGQRGADEASRYTWSEAAARLRRLYAQLTDRRLVACR